MKIAHLQLLPLLSGVQRVSLDELLRLDNKRFEPYLICKEDGPLVSEAKKNGIKCFFCKSLTRNISLKNDMLSFWYLYKLFKKHRFDVVHTHSSKTGVLGRVAAKLAGVPKVIHTVHGFAFPAATNIFSKSLYYAMEWIGTRCSDYIICLHDADRNIVINNLGAKSNKVIIIPNGVDIKKFSPASDVDKIKKRNELNFTNTTNLIGMVGRLWRQKNPAVFVDAGIELLRKNVNADFVLVGDGELMNELKEKVEVSGFSSKFHFLGWRDDIPEILSLLDIFVLPSLWEGMPLAILEAQSSGLPCVVSNIQGNDCLVTNNQDGYLFNPESVSELVDILNTLIADKEKQINLGKFARSKITAHFDIDNRIKKMMDLYDRE